MLHTSLREDSSSQQYRYDQQYTGYGFWTTPFWKALNPQ